MKLKIIVDEVMKIGHDLGTNDGYPVKIVLPGNPYPAVLQQNEDDSSPVSAKAFLDNVNKYGTSGIGIVVEENIVAGSKAWICHCNDVEDEEEVHCTVEERSGTVVVNRK